MITTDRNQFIGAHLTEEEKKKLQEMANKSNPRRSMSKIIHDSIRRTLLEAGFHLTPETK